MTAQSVMPSITLPCHMSIFHSVPPTRHGITSNTYTPMARPITGLIDAADDASKSCAAVYNWEELRDISRPGTLHTSYYVRTSYDIHNGDAAVTDAAVPLISAQAHDFIFVYLGTIDSSGHFFGWMSPEYLEQVSRVDGYVGRLLDALPADGVMLMQADHGGHDRFHGTDMPEDMTIPWILYGKGIHAGHRIQRSLTLLDTAPTIAALLGIRMQRDWEGTPVEEAWA
jgi:hypothetical protein